MAKEIKRLDAKKKSHAKLDKHAVEGDYTFFFHVFHFNNTFHLQVIVAMAERDL